VRADGALVVVWEDQVRQEIFQKVVDFGLGAAAKDLAGGPGPDSFRGSGENDTLSGEGGADRLEGLGGDDLLTGGADADTFVFAAGAGNDTITDWQDGIDALELDGIAVASQTVAEATGDATDDTVVTFDSGDVVILAGVEITDPIA
jgi:Ca2+-binding RTX toxin-like protein